MNGVYCRILYARDQWVADARSREALFLFIEVLNEFERACLEDGNQGLFRGEGLVYTKVLLE